MFGMGGYNSFAPLIFIIVAGFFIGIVWRLIASRGGMGIHTNLTTLVLRSFKIDESPNAETIIEITGRKEGLIQWFLTVIGINPEISFRFANDDILFKSASLFGQSYSSVPLPSVSSTHCGYSKPLGFLVFGVFFILFGIFFGMVIASQSGGAGILIFVLGLIFGVLFLILYWLRKKIYIAIHTKGGLSLGLSFKRSIMENISVDFEQAVRVIKIINRKITGSQSKSYNSIIENIEINEKICPKCGWKNDANSKFCEKCGEKLSA
jgi:ribosomal protein L40E